MSDARETPTADAVIWREAHNVLSRKIEAALALHVPDEDGNCEGCGLGSDEEPLHNHPCPTVKALRGDQVCTSKYSRDGVPGITVGEVIQKLLAAETVDAFCDVLDEEFIFGAWAHIFGWRGAGPSDAWLLAKDIRGLLWAMAEKLRGEKP